MAAVQVLAQIGERADPEGKGKRYVFGSKDGDVWIAADRTGTKYCSHVHTYSALASYLHSNAGKKNICPTCATVGEPGDSVTFLDDGFWLPPVLTLWGILSLDPALFDLRNLVACAGLVDTLATDGPFTLFAPSNSALRQLSVVPTGDALITTLKHHVVTGSIFSKDISSGVTEVTTLAGTKLYVRRDGATIFVSSVRGGRGDDARVFNADVRATNGVAHIIDRVLVPSALSTSLSSRVSDVKAPTFLDTGVGEPSSMWNGSIFEAIAWTPRLSTLTHAIRYTGLAGTLDSQSGAKYTVFAPTETAFAELKGPLPDKDALRNILLHHVVEGEVFSSQVPASGSVELNTLTGDTLTARRTSDGKGVMIGVSNVILADFQANNGVVHVVDALLLPSTPVAATAAAAAGATDADELTLANRIGMERQFFRAFDVTPDPFATHRSESAAESVELSKFEDRFRWTSTVGEGYVIPFMKQKSAYGEGIDDLMRSAKKTSDFEIAYTVMLPKSWDYSRVRGANDNKTVILMLHGVPTSRKWKYHMMEIMAKRGCIVVACDLLGMGESTQVMDYRRFSQSDDEDDVNSAWDWKHDVAWLRAFISGGILSNSRLGFQTKTDVVVAADDWGAGPAEWLFAEVPELVSHLILINPIHLDGYFVIEIGTIGRTDAVRRKKGNAAFQQGAFTLPQVILGIEKYMVQDRKRMNRYTESSYMSQYQDTNYQAGNTAADMQPHYWNLAVLAARASRLAPRQLQPYEVTDNPSGLPFYRMPRDKPTDIIWGIEDQMMPPIQMWRSVYAFPGRLQSHPIAGANHFSEIDQPYRVADAMTSAILRENKEAIPVFLGDNPEYVYKGDEDEMRGRLGLIYRGAPVFGGAFAGGSSPT